MRDRILLIIQKKLGSHHGANTEFAKSIGASEGTVGDWLSGRSKPRDNYRRLICKQYNISRVWLDTGDGPMVAPPPEKGLSGAADGIMAYQEVGKLEEEVRALREVLEKFDKRLNRYEQHIYIALQSCAEGIKNNIKKEVV